MPDVESRSVRTDGLCELWLHALGAGVRLASTRPALLDRFAAIFARLVVLPDARPPALAMRIEEAGGGAGFQVAVEHDGRSDDARLPNEERLLGYVYARILDRVARHDPRLLCVHAAALARDGRAIAIVAPSHHGKSTLTLSLVARGYRFLSDELAPIERATLRVLPFPIAVGCRAGTARLLSGTPFAAHGFAECATAGKTFLCPPGGVESRAVPLDATFFLEPEPLDVGRARLYRMVVEPGERGVAERLAAIDGIREVRVEAGGREIALEVASGAWVAPEVERLLASAGVVVASVEQLGTPRPDFAAEPRLARLGTAAGVLGLLRHLRGFGALEELIAAGGFGGLVAALAGTMRGVRFHRLTPGRLPRLVEAIESVRPAAPSGAGD